MSKIKYIHDLFWKNVVNLKEYNNANVYILIKNTEIKK